MIIERETEPRAFIQAPDGSTIEILESLPAANEPAGLVPPIFLVLRITQANESESLGTAGNLAAALQCAAIEIARRLVEQLTPTERAQASAKLRDDQAPQTDDAAAAVLAELLRRAPTTTH